MSNINVRVSTFVNPYLLWIQDTDSLHNLVHMQNSLQKVCKVKNGVTFQEGDIVGVLYENTFYRGIIEQCIENSGSDNSINYLCWLIDYAVIVESDKICKLSADFKKIAPFSKQACLSNIAFVEEKMEYNLASEGVITKKITTTPNMQVRDEILNILKNYKQIDLALTEDYNGILMGDLLLKNANKNVSLTKLLTEKGVIQTNEPLFEGIKEKLLFFKDNYVQFIKQISRDVDLNISGLSLSLQDVSLDQYEERDVYNSSDSFRSLSKNDSKPKASLSPSNTSEKSENGVKNRKKIILQKIQNMKKMAESENSSDSMIANSSLKENESPNILEVNNSFKEEKTSSNFSDFRELSDREPRPVSFLPAGINLGTAKAPPTSKTSNNLLKNGWKKHHSTPVKQNESLTSISSPSVKNLSVTSLSETPKFPESTTSQDSDNESRSSKPEVKNKAETSGSEMDAIGQNFVSGPSKIKPTCSCRNCEHYTVCTNFQVAEGGKKIKLETIKPDPLFLKEEENPERKAQIVSINYSEMTKLEKQHSGKILVHGLNLPKPVKQVQQIFALHEKIRRVLDKKGYTECKRLQTYAWPAILRQNNVFVIHNAKTGKTMSYLPVIASFLMERVRIEQWSSFTGPVAIILCENTKKCEDIFDLFNVFLKSTCINFVLGTYPHLHNIKNSNCIDILITTPNILINQLKANKTNFKRLTHLIIEDCDILLKTYQSSMENIFKVIEDMLSHRVCAIGVQIVVTAEHWSQKLKKLAKNLARTPMIIMGNFFEAAHYGKVNFSLVMSDTTRKDLELRKLLKNTYNIYKTILICNEADLEELQNTLIVDGIENIVLKPNDSKEDKIFAEEQWNTFKSGVYKVLVCTDVDFNTELTVTNADVLINYSMPSSWTRFTTRYSCFLETFKNAFDKDDGNFPLKSYVFADENSIKGIPRFLEYFHELGVELPPALYEVEKELHMKREEQKVVDMISLCPELCLFGKTCENTKCHFRHLLDKKLDSSDQIPKSGKIKFKIITFKDVSNFSVRLIESTLKNEVKKYESHEKLTNKLTDMLKDTEPMKNLNNEKLCAYYDIDDGEGVFYRCKILKEKNDEVEIYLVDTDIKLKTLKSHLFQLPDEFLDIPSTVLNAYIANLVPPFEDRNYSACSFLHIKNFLEKSNYKKKTLTADIHLQLGNIVYIGNVAELVDIDNDVQVYPFQISREILRLKCAVADKSQLEGLKKMCEEVGIEVPKVEVAVKSEVRIEQVKPSWAFFNQDSVEDVIFCAGVSPDEFYVKLKRFSSQLSNLQEEIQKLIIQKPSKQLSDVEVGKCYLGKDPEGSDFSRVLVLKKENDKALCFFVDFGDEWVFDVKDLKHLPNHYILKLPFQCIKCSLHGIKSVDEKWCDEALVTLYDYSLQPNSNIFRTLLVKSCFKNKLPLGSQNSYSVLLKDGFGDKNVLINKLLVDCGFASMTIKHFDDFEMPQQNDDDEEQYIDEEEKQRTIKEFEREFDNNIENGTYKFDINNFEVCINETEDFFKDLLKSKKFGPEPQKTQKLAVENGEKSQNSTLPHLQALPPVDYLTPDVYWSQTDHVIKLNIRITDVDKYDISLSRNRLFKFSTTKNGNKYVVNLMLFEKATSFQHTVLGPQVRVTLIKEKDLEWPRLLISKEKAHNIRYDVSSLKIEDEKKKRFLTIDDPEGENESDDENAPMYVQESDEDSEFAEEFDELSD